MNRGRAAPAKKPINSSANNNSRRKSSLMQKKDSVEVVQVKQEKEVVQEEQKSVLPTHSVAVAETEVRKEKPLDVELIALKTSHRTQSAKELKNAKLDHQHSIRSRKTSLCEESAEKKKPTVVCDVEVPLEQILTTVFADVTPNDTARTISPDRISLSRSGGKYTPNYAALVKKEPPKPTTGVRRPVTKSMSATTTRKPALPPHPVVHRAKKPTESTEQKEKVNKVDIHEIKNFSEANTTSLTEKRAGSTHSTRSAPPRKPPIYRMPSRQKSTEKENSVSPRTATKSSQKPAANDQKPKAATTKKAPVTRGATIPGRKN